MTTLQFDEWQDAGGTPVLRFEAGVLEVWDGAAWSAPTGAGVASGGGSSVTEGGFQFEIFTAGGTLTVSRAGYFDFMLVAGGAGGGSAGDNSNYSGGGGAGGCQVIEQIFLDAGSYPVGVGAGGALSNWTAWGGDGGDSFIGDANSAYAALGGGGGGRVNSAGRDGASGGGGTTWSGVNNLQTGGTNLLTGQGFSGGDVNGNAGRGGGGGGGGQAGSGSASGTSNGGDGKIVSWINTGIATTYSIGEVSGSDVYFSGGGAGGANSSRTGGLGGGGDGKNGNTRGDAGVDGTGGAGGGSASGSGGAGGDGVVVVRFKL